MAVTDGFDLQYEDMKPYKKYKTIKPVEINQRNNMKESKQSKQYTKTRGEHVKDIVITILITGIIAFIAGAIFQDKQNNAVTSAVKAVTPVVNAEQPVKK